MLKHIFYRDWREINVISNKRSVPIMNLGRKSGSFTIVNRYPLPNDGGDIGSLLLKKGILISMDTL